MSKKAAQFVTQLSEDPQKMQEFKQDPDAAMTKAGLTEEDKKVLKSGNPEKIRQHLGDEGPPGCMVMV